MLTLRPFGGHTLLWGDGQHHRELPALFPAFLLFRGATAISRWQRGTQGWGRAVSKYIRALAWLQRVELGQNEVEIKKKKKKWVSIH